MKRVALITGAGSGIGRATALALSKAPDLFKVIATDVNADNLASLVSESPDIRAEVMDVTKYEDIEIIVPGIANSEGGLHVLVNDAGIAPMGPIELLSEEWHRKAFEVNYFGTVKCIRTALPYMRESAPATPLGSHLINISSTSGLISLPFADAYCASKYAIEGLSEAMALTLPQMGVKVSLVEPGPTATRLSNSMVLSVKEILEDYDDQYTEMLKIFWPNFAASSDPKYGAHRPEEVAEVIKNVLAADKPHLRNITQLQAATLATAKYKDLQGDKTLAAVQEFMENVWHVSRDFKQVLSDKPPGGGVL